MRMSVPPSSRWVAKECRRTCGLNLFVMAAFLAALQRALWIAARVESVNGNTRLKNAWQGTYLNVENQTGYAQCSNLPSNYTSSYWTLDPK